VVLAGFGVLEVGHGGVCRVCWGERKACEEREVGGKYLLAEVLAVLYLALTLRLQLVLVWVWVWVWVLERFR
jgi:hypothetical protein